MSAPNIRPLAAPRGTRPPIGAAPPSPPDSADEGLDLLAIWAVLRRRQRIIAATAVLLTAIGAAVVLQITPRYTAAASLMLDQRKNQVVDIQSVVSGLPSDAMMIQSEIELMKSPAIAEKVVKKLDLTAVPEFNPRLQKPSALAPLHQAAQWLFTQVAPLVGIHPAAPAAAPDQAAADLQAATAGVLGHTSILNDGRSYIIKVHVESESPALAAAIANAYADAYLDGQLEAKFEAVRRANTWLSDHLATLRSKVEATDRAVQMFKSQHNLVQSKGGGTITSQQMAELNSQLVLASADLAQKESNLKQIQDQLRSGGVAAAAQVLASPLIQRLKEQETDLMTREAELATRYKPAFPAMINIKAQQRDLEKKIQIEINKIVAGMGGEVAAARAKVVALRESLEVLQKSTATQNQAEVQLHELEREADANRTLYQNFLNRFQQTSAQQDIQQPDARLVARASVPRAPSYPKTTPLIGIIFIGSLMIGVLAAFGVERLDNGFRNGEQLDKIAGITTLGLVPNLDRDEPPQDILITQPVSPYAEAIRTVRTSLRYSDVDNPPKVILVTSSLPDEGKTMFAASLARSVAASGGRALLIDCDLRRPAVHKLFRSTATPGILALFEDGADQTAIIRVDEASGLHFIPATAETANPQDLLGSQQMRTLIATLRSQYDLIVLDTPPVLAVSDALVLSHIADTTMFLIRWARTPRRVVLGALRMFAMNGGNLSGVVLSRVNFRRHAGYGYGDQGYFYGNYRKYYGSYGEG